MLVLPLRNLASQGERHRTECGRSNGITQHTSINHSRCSSGGFGSGSAAARASAGCSDSAWVISVRCSRLNLQVAERSAIRCIDRYLNAGLRDTDDLPVLWIGDSVVDEVLRTWRWLRNVEVCAETIV